MGIEIGLAAIGTAVTGAFGVTVGTLAATAIGGAIVGAAIGGLTAAVMGGDIGKGMLFGAVGGAVMGYVMAPATGGTMIGTEAGYTATGLQTGGVFDAAVGADAWAVAGAEAGGQGVIGGVLPSITMDSTVASASMLESVGMQVGVNALSTGVKSYLAAGAQEDASASAMEQQNAQLDKLLEQQRMKGEQALQQISAQRDTASAAEIMVTGSRTAELEQRKNEFDQTLGFQREQYAQTQQNQANRQALFGGETRRGGIVDDTYTDTGIYDELQKKPVTALVG